MQETKMEQSSDILLEKTNMPSILELFPTSSYKYGLVIPSIALMIDRKYTINHIVYKISEYDRLFLESLVHTVSNGKVTSTYSPIDYGAYAIMLNEQESKGFDLYSQYIYRIKDIRL